MEKKLLELQVEAQRKALAEVEKQREFFKQDLMKALGVNAENVPTPGTSESLNIQNPNPNSNLNPANMGMDPNVASDQMEGARSPRTRILKNPRTFYSPSLVRVQSAQAQRKRLPKGRSTRTDSQTKVGNGLNKRDIRHKQNKDIDPAWMGGFNPDTDTRMKTQKRTKKQ